MNKNILEKVREIAMRESDDWDRKNHIPYVVRNAKLLARKLGADEGLAEIAALLHDVGRKFGDGDHEITGVKEAEKILGSLRCSRKVIDEVKHCIESHRGSKDVKPKTKLAKIIANADAMAHFETVPALLQIFLKNENNDVETASRLVYEKIGRDWNKKLTIPEAREMMREKYAAIRLLFAPAIHNEDPQNQNLKNLKT